MVEGPGNKKVEELYLKDRTTVKTHNLVKVTNITSGNFKTLWLLSVSFV